MVWQAFIDLLATRSVGMAVGPITYGEIAAYNALTCADLGPWEVATIRRMDLALMGLKSKPPSKPADDGLISTKNASGVASFMRSLAAQKNAEKAAE